MLYIVYILYIFLAIRGRMHRLPFVPDPDTAVVCFMPVPIAVVAASATQSWVYGHKVFTQGLTRGLLLRMRSYSFPCHVLSLAQ